MPNTNPGTYGGPSDSIRGACLPRTLLGQRKTITPTWEALMRARRLILATAIATVVWASPRIVEGFLLMDLGVTPL